MTGGDAGDPGRTRPRRGVDAVFAVQLTVVVLSTTAVNAIRPMITYRALGLGAGAFEVGLLAAIFSVAPVFLAILIGRSVDRVGEAVFIRAAVAAMTVGAVMAATVGSLVLLAVSQVVTGLGHVTNLIAGQALVANRGGRSGRDHRYGYYSTMGSVGQLAGPLLATTVVGQWHVAGLVVGGPANPQAPAFLLAAVATALSLGLAFLLPGRRPAGGDATEQGAATPTERVGLLSAARSVLRRPGMPSAMVVSMIVVSSVDLLVAYLPLFGEARGIAVGVVGALLAVRAGASIVSRLFMGHLIAWFGRNLLLAVSMGLAAGGLLALPFAEGTVVLAALMVLIGPGLGLGQPMTMAWVANRSPRAERGTALGLRLTGNRAALMVMPVAVGAAAGAAGVSLIFWLLAGLLGAGAVVGYLVPVDPEAPDAGRPPARPG